MFIVLQDRQKITFNGPVHPRRSPYMALPLHTGAVHRQGFSWGLPSLSLTTKASGCTSGWIAKPLVRALWRQYPCKLKTMLGCFLLCVHYLHCIQI